jgi:hypothetical protein
MAPDPDPGADPRRNGKASIELQPFDGFEIDYTIEYPAPVGRSVFFPVSTTRPSTEGNAPARRSYVVKDISALQNRGSRSAAVRHFVLYGEDGRSTASSVSPTSRPPQDQAPAEPVTSWAAPAARVIARMTGHSQNISLLKKVRELL